MKVRASDRGVAVVVDGDRLTLRPLRRPHGVVQTLRHRRVDLGHRDFLVDEETPQPPGRLVDAQRLVALVVLHVQLVGIQRFIQGRLRRFA
jgi:hypothetical protein